MKKIYSTPEVTVHKYDLSPLMDDALINTSDIDASGSRQSKGTGGGGIDWDAFDNDTEE